MGRLQGKVAIVTGGCGGIGSATGRIFAAEGAHVLLVDVDEKNLKEAVRTTESDLVSYHVADVTSEEQSKAYIDAAVHRYGGVDVVFANAGIEGKLAPTEQIHAADFDRVFAVNVKGAWLAIKHATPHLRERGGGSIILTSSVAGLIGFPGLAPYVCSKHALVGLAKTAALELAPAKIRVNTIHPGPIANRMMESLEEQSAPADPSQARTGFEGMIPLGRYGTNDEIAKLALFLAGDEGSYCTGAAFVADGGFCAR